MRPLWQTVPLAGGRLVMPQDNVPFRVELVARFNTLMEKLEETAAVKFPLEETEWRQAAIEIEGLSLLMECLKGSYPTRAKVITTMFNPLLARLMDDLARKRSTGPDRVRQKPAEYVLTSSLWKADCAAAADVLIRSRMTRGYVEKEWLVPALVRHGLSDHTTAKKVIDWRDEVVKRLPAHWRIDKTVGGKKPLNMMAELFDQLRPTGPDGKRERLSQTEAEKLANELLQDARLNIPKTSP